MQHIHTVNLDNPHQSTFITGHSTETALLHIKNEIQASLFCGEPTALVLQDLFAAINTIVHDTLLNCLRSCFCMCNTPLKWFFFSPATDSKQLKIRQPSQNTVSCCLEYCRALSLDICFFSLHTTPLIKFTERNSYIKFQFYADNTQ